ncbi:MAG: nitroreductase family protein [Coraliomargarita sp.]
MPNESANLIDRIIRTRITEKVLIPLSERPPVPAEVEAANKALVESALQTAGWAPFHYPCKDKTIVEPWRAHILWNKETRKLADYLTNELKLPSKEPLLAAGCSALVLINWLPEACDENTNEKVRIRNEEHIAATSAMTQNFLLMLTAHGMGNYWSSGGCLRTPELFDYLKIPQHERLLGAIFIEYPEMQKEEFGSPQRKPGALRKQRGTDWINTIQR